MVKSGLSLEDQKSLSHEAGKVAFFDCYDVDQSLILDRTMSVEDVRKTATISQAVRLVEGNLGWGRDSDIVVSSVRQGYIEARDSHQNQWLHEDYTFGGKDEDNPMVDEDGSLLSLKYDPIQEYRNREDIKVQYKVQKENRDKVEEVMDKVHDLVDKFPGFDGTKDLNEIKETLVKLFV